MSVARYVAPDTLEEVLDEMSVQDGSYGFMAGGTIVQPLLSAGSWLPSTVIGLWRAPLDATIQNDETLIIGAGTRLRDLANRDVPSGLRDAARQVGGPAVRNRATLGGNVASSHGDLIVPLLALGALVTLASPAGTRDVSIDELFAPAPEEANGDIPGVKGDELLTSVVIPRSTGRSAYAYLGRKAYNTPLVVAAAVEAVVDPTSNTVRAARVAVQGPSRWPVRAHAVERAIIGRTLENETLNDAEAALAALGSGYSDAVASAWYRASMSKVVLRRALIQIAEGGQS